MGDRRLGAFSLDGFLVKPNAMFDDIVHRSSARIEAAGIQMPHPLCLHRVALTHLDQRIATSVPWACAAGMAAMSRLMGAPGTLEGLFGGQPTSIEGHSVPPPPSGFSIETARWRRPLCGAGDVAPAAFQRLRRSSSGWRRRCARAPAPALPGSRRSPSASWCRRGRRSAPDRPRATDTRQPRPRARCRRR